MSYTLDTIRLLIAHDSQDEAEQLTNTLRNAGKLTRAEMALSEDDVIKALKAGSWECVLCRPTVGKTDYQGVIAHMHRLGKSVPVILLADQQDSETWRDAMTHGVRYVVPSSDKDLLSLYLDRALELVRLRKDLQQSQLSLHDAEKRLSVLMDQSRDAIAYVVDGMHIHANDAYLEIFGYPSADDLAGVPIMDMVSASDHESLKKLLRSRAQDESQTQELECKGVSQEGNEFDATFIFSPSTYDGEACTQIVIRTSAVDESALEEKLQEMRQTDPITGLYNRGWLLEKLDEALSDAVRSGKLSAVLMMRINNFESHQATLGIDGSDELLGTVAMALEKYSGEHPLARISGEDFAFIRPVEDMDEAGQLAEKIRADFEKMMPAVRSRTVKLTASVGVAFVREDSHSNQAVLTKALECCNRADAANDGKGNAIYVHNPMDDVEAGSSEAIAMLLRAALEKSRLKLNYQAIMSMEDDGSGGFVEVFVTLPQDDGNDMPASQFMPVAHDRGLAGKIDRWVILNAIKAAAAFPSPVRLLINLSGYSLEDPALGDWISKALRAAKLDGKMVVFQFAEADLDGYLKQASAFADKLHGLGCTLSASRFGGATEPMHLFDHVPVDMVKFEPSFTEGLATPEGKQKLSELAAQLVEREKKIMVGFVESAGQMQSLWTVSGINFLQGIYMQAPSDKINLGDD